MKFLKPSASIDVKKLKSKGDVARLIKALGHEDWWVRSEAAEALGTIGDPKSTDPLISLLGDEALPVRLKVIQALGNIKDERAVMPLAATLKDEFQSVQDATEQSLKQIASPEAQHLLIEYHKMQDADKENMRLADEERIRLLSSNILSDFVNEKKGGWEDREWIDLLSTIRNAGYTHISDEVIERLLKATRDNAARSDETTILSPTTPSTIAVTHTPAIQITPDTICVTCKKCGQIYKLGKDAVVSAFFMIANDHIAVLSNQPSTIYDTTPAAPDLIAHLERPWNSLNQSFSQKQIPAIRTITSLLNSGAPRWWRCENCKEVQEYPKIVGPATLVETQPRVSEGTPQASPPLSVETKGTQQTVSPNNPLAKGLIRIGWVIGFIVGYFLFDTYVAKRVYTLENIISGLLIAVVVASMCASWVKKQLRIK